MKNINKILCMLALLICVSIAMPACTPTIWGFKPWDSKAETTIQLDEAKTMIVNALEIDPSSSVSQNAKAQTTSSNRNIFVKLINAEVLMAGNFDYGNQIAGAVERTNNIWSGYNLMSGDCYGYFDGSNAYTKFGSAHSASSFEESYFGLILQSFDCVYVDLLFIENAWISIYENAVTKTTQDFGWSLTFNVNMANYVDFVMFECDQRGLPAEGLFGDGEAQALNKSDGSVSLTVNFDKSFNIIGLDFAITSYAFYGSIENRELATTSLSISKSNDKLSSPEWFDINDFVV